jgi:transcription termination factor Rho
MYFEFEEWKGTGIEEMKRNRKFKDKKKRKEI